MRAKLYIRGKVVMGMIGMLVGMGGVLVLGAQDTYATSSVSISTPATIDLELLPTSEGSAALSISNVSIASSGTEGFRVMMSSSSTTLTRASHADEAGIESISKETVYSNLPTNTWGVYFGSSNPGSSSVFMPIPTNTTEVAYNELANASGTYKLAIGAKADTSLPAGTYRGDIVVSVVAEPQEVTSLAEATYMQDITPEICSNSKIWETEADSVSLIDKRDGKAYKVARLKDGNCWMQENLKLTLSTDKLLTSEDSDIALNEDGSMGVWVPEKNTATRADVSGETSWQIDGNFYYAWGTATAGSAAAGGTEAQQDICPRGWKMPTVKSNGSYADLISRYPYTSIWNSGYLELSPLNFKRVGFVEMNGGGLLVNGADSYNWTRSVAGTNAPYNFYFGSTDRTVDLYNSNPKDKGMTIRCVTVVAQDMD